MKSTLLSLTLLAAVTMNAQLTTATSDWKGFCDNVADLGSNGIAIINALTDDGKTETTVAWFDGNGAALWTKTYPVKSPRCYSCASADGKDLYLVDIQKEDEGGENPQVIHIDATTGTSTSKDYPQKDFGAVLSMYANKKYFFVCTTKYGLNDSRMEKDHTLKLYRFDRETMEMKLLDHDMNNASDDPRVFWQFIRVEDDFVEGYFINEADQKVTMTLGKFDNEGKKISTKEASFDLGEMMARQTNGLMPLAPGIGRGRYPQNVCDNLDNSYTMIYPMCSTYLQYDPFSKKYFACGICGPGVQKQLGTRYTGFYIAKLDADFKLELFKESASVPLLTDDKLFSINTLACWRYISASFTPDSDIRLAISDNGDGRKGNAYQFYISETNLITKYSAKEEFSSFMVFGIKSGPADHFLATNEEIVSKAKKASVLYVATTTRQYAVLLPYSDKPMSVYSDKME